MRNPHKLIRGALAAALFVGAAATLPAQENLVTTAVLYGRCAVEAETWRDNFGDCGLTGTSDNLVPAGQTLVIDYVAATCRGPIEHPVVTLALSTQLRPADDAGTQIVIPLSRRDATTEAVSRYEASLTTRLYAGPGTKIETYLALEKDFSPPDEASCGVMFHGRLVTAYPWAHWGPYWPTPRR